MDVPGNRPTTTGDNQIVVADLDRRMSRLERQSLWAIVIAALAVVLFVVSFAIAWKNQSADNLFNGITSLATALTLGFAVFSLWADHDRRKKQATMEHMNSVRDYYHNKRRVLIDVLFGEDEAKNLTEQEALDIRNGVTRYKDGTSVRRDVRDLLSLFEHLSAGVNKNVFDFNLLANMSSDYLIRRFEMFQAYIEAVRNAEDAHARHANYFAEYHALANKLREKKGLPPIVLKARSS